MIDWNFIAAREGGRILHGYVPKAPGDKSGVTIGDGVDLGYYARSDCEQLPGDLPAKLAPYIGLTGQSARNALASAGLTVTAAEADAIEQPKRSAMQVELSAHYLRSAAFAFEKLPDPAQTVIMSVTWQYGAPWSDCPHFWRLCCERNWPGVVAELENFGDAYDSRRKLEASYLKHGLGL